MFTMTPKTATVVTGVVIELTGDDVSHLTYALGELERYRREDPKNSGIGRPAIYMEWSWLKRFRASLSKAREE